MEGTRAWGRGVGVCQQQGTATGAVWGAEPRGQRELGTAELLQVCCWGWHRVPCARDALWDSVLPPGAFCPCTVLPIVPSPTLRQGLTPPSRALLV